MITHLPPPPRVPNLEREQELGYRAACARWGAEPATGRDALDPSHGETAAPPRRRP